jgi:hypothetical protein
MKAPAEIVKFIHDMQRHMLQRPQMYASSPQSLEEQLTLLENLRTFVLSDQPGFPAERAYADYAARVGKCGAMSFTGRYSHEVWAKFCTFFKNYLVSQGRPQQKKRSPKVKQRRNDE